MEHDERIAKLEVIVDAHAAEILQLRQETLQRFIRLEDRIERGFVGQRDYTDKLRDYCDKNFAELRTSLRWIIGLLITVIIGLASVIVKLI